ncbi:MAG: hypothetical protein COW84_00615 [Gammaproteobacteria bacterium CG22_combo_CG10-13_8_21_14_all_40_8]|nr:MAG: hypothetical protein COW84_00615 [Gammaproteobacteria bacterium CG22_combo_CG10-13_8_21_14_all_40_8]
MKNKGLAMEFFALISPFWHPWRKTMIQSLFHWLSLVFMLALLLLAIQLKFRGHFDLPPGVRTDQNYFTFGFDGNNKLLLPVSKIQSTLLKQTPYIQAMGLYTEEKAAMKFDSFPAQSFTIGMLNADFFAALDLLPAAGTLLSSVPALGVQQVLISHKLWERQFAQSASLIGSQVVVDGIGSWQVVGVLPKGFTGFKPYDVDVWMSADNDFRFVTRSGIRFGGAIEDLLQKLTDERLPNHYVFGILSAGSRVRDLQFMLSKMDFKPPPPGEINGMPLSIDNAYTKADPLVIQGLDPNPAISHRVKQYSNLLLMAALALAVLVVANLLLFLAEKTPQRRQEFMLRYSLGASPWDIFFQVLGEMWLFFLTAVPASYGFSLLFFDYLSQIKPFSLYIPSRLFAPDLWSFTVLLSLTFFIATLISLVPVRFANRLIVHSARTMTASVKTLLLQRLLNVIQIAAALISLFLATLFALNLNHLTQVAWGGFNQKAWVASWQCDFPEACEKHIDQKSFYEASTLSTDRDNLAFAELMPFSKLSLSSKTLRLAKLNNSGQIPGTTTAAVVAISDNFFNLLQIPLKAGRTFNDASKQEIVINEAMAKELGVGADKLLNQSVIFEDFNHTELKIAGVIADMRYIDPRVAARPMIYHSSSVKWREFSFHSLILSSQSSRGLIKSLVADGLVAQGIKNVEVSVETIEERIQQQLQNDRHFAQIVMFCSALAVLLATLGIYANVAEAIEKNRRALGIRMAVGANFYQISKQLASPYWVIFILALLLSATVGITLISWIKEWLIPLQGSLIYLAVVVFTGVAVTVGISLVLALLKLRQINPAHLLKSY